MSRILNEDVIRDACIKGGSIHEAARILGINYQSMRKYAKQLGIPAGKRDHSTRYSALTADDVKRLFLSNEKQISSSQLRELLFRTDIKKRICERCGMSEWMGSPIPLELHHKNENHYDNSEENLMVVCPTCHAQLTWQDKINKDIIAEKAAREKAKLALLYKESSIAPDEIHGAKFSCTKQELLDLLQQYGTYTAVSKHFGVSLAAIKNRCRRFQILEEASTIIAKHLEKAREERLKDIRDTTNHTYSAHPVAMCDLQTGEIIKVYGSAFATKGDDFIPSHVTECCNGKRHKHKGYSWRFYN